MSSTRGDAEGKERELADKIREVMEQIQKQEASHENSSELYVTIMELLEEYKTMRFLERSNHLM